MADLFEPDAELRWRGKQEQVKTVTLPFQTAERVNTLSRLLTPSPTAGTPKAPTATPSPTKRATATP